VARNDYNQAAQQYNTYIRRFPQVLTAKVIGAKPKTYFEVTNPANREAPTVDFSKPASSAPSSNPTSSPSSAPQTP
jgi:LemA protein